MLLQTISKPFFFHPNTMQFYNLYIYNLYIYNNIKFLLQVLKVFLSQISFFFEIIFISVIFKWGQCMWGFNNAHYTICSFFIKIKVTYPGDFFHQPAHSGHIHYFSHGQVNHIRQKQMVTASSYHQIKLRQQK